MSARWTVGTVLAAAADYLKKQNPGSSRLEAELLLAHALNLSRVDLYAQYERPLSEDERGAFKGLIKARLTGKPLQYITGVQAFRHLVLKVEPGVFIPRPETEILVERVIEAVDRRDGQVAILELGVGSGAIALSLAKEVAGATVWAVDLSEKSLAVAQANAAAHGLDDHVEFFQGDLFAPLPPPAVRRYDVIVANPPYIPTGDLAGLQAEVRDFEPPAALDGGPAGLRLYERTIDQAPDYLADGGIIAFEVGEGQTEAVTEMLTGRGFAAIEVHKDYADIDRVVLARKISDSYLFPGHIEPGHDT